MPRHNNDIIGKLKRASSIPEIESLLLEASTFEGLSDKTKRRHQRIAKLRREYLEDLGK